MKFTVILLSVMIGFFDIVIAAESTAVIETTSGPVQGEILDSVNSVQYASFKGIRYAKAPVGNLRFKPPVVADQWTEIFSATVEGDNCTQFDSDTKSVVGSEDCLFINVFTPETNLSDTPKNLRSVMVWIHGGAFKRGSSSTKLYPPDYLIEKNVVYVSFNYRIGPLGFLSLGHPDATGNAGLKDQVLALKWVQANIDKFGGNPKNVTIFGQSSGSACVGSHVLSDASAGLFHGAIGMSGMPLNSRFFLTPSTAFSRAVNLSAAITGNRTTDKDALIETFSNAAAADLVQAVESLTLISPPFAPTIEDESIATDIFFSECPFIKYLTGNFTKVPQILGHTDQETIYYVSTLERIAEFIVNNTDISAEFGMNLPKNLVSEIRNSLNDTSTNNLGEIIISHNAFETLINITTDFIYVAQIDQTQRLLAVGNDDKPIYYYHVSFSPVVSRHNVLQNNNIRGVAHADDLAYIFYFPPVYNTDPKDPVALTINRVSTMWTNFAKYGNPTPDWIDDNSINVTWPNSGSSGVSLDIGDELMVGPRSMNRFLRQLESYSWPILRKTNGCM